MKRYQELSGRFLSRQRRRTTLTIIGIILSVSLITGVQIIYQSFMDYSIREQRKNSNYHGYFFNVNHEDAIKIKNSVGIKKATYMKNIGLTYFDYGNETEGAHFVEGDVKNAKNFTKVRIKGIDIQGFKHFNIKAKEGRLPLKEDEIIIPQFIFEMLGTVKIGDTIKIKCGETLDGNNNKLDERVYADVENFKAINEKSYRIVGISDNERHYSSDCNLMFTYLNHREAGNYIVFVDFKRPGKAYEVAADIEQSFKLTKTSGYYFAGNDGLLRFYGGSKNLREGLTIKLLILVMTVIIIVTTISVISNSFNISIIEKSSEYGMLRAIGASPKQIRKLVLREASIMAYIGIPLGLLGGFIGMQLLYMVFGMLNYNILKQLDLRIVFKPEIFIIAILVSAITIFLSAAMPARRAAAVAPVEALKRVDRGIRVRKSKKHKFIRKIFGPEGEIAYKNLNRNKKRLIITVFSLSLSIMIYIAFDSLVNQVIYISEAKLAKYSYSIEINDRKDVEEIEKNFRLMKDVDRTVISISASTFVKASKDKLNMDKVWDGAFNGPKGKRDFALFYNNEFRALDETYIKSLEQYISSGEINISELDKGGVLLLQKNVSYEGNEPIYLEYTSYKPGDYVDFADGRSMEGSPYENIESAKTIKARVVGIIDAIPLFNELPQHGIIMLTTESGMNKLGLKADNPDIYVIKKPDSKDDDISKYISQLEKEKKIGYIDNKEEDAKEDMQLFIVISILVYGFIALIIFISSVNIFNTISSNLFLRKKELGVIKSVGMSQGALRKMIYLESFYYGMFSIILGGLTGVGLSFLLYRIFRISQNVKWTLGVKSILIAALCTMLLTTLSTYLPLKKLDSQNIIDSIKVEE